MTRWRFFNDMLKFEKLSPKLNVTKLSYEPILTLLIILLLTSMVKWMMLIWHYYKNVWVHLVTFYPFYNYLSLFRPIQQLGNHFYNDRVLTFPSLWDAPPWMTEEEKKTQFPRIELETSQSEVEYATTWATTVDSIWLLIKLHFLTL